MSLLRFRFSIGFSLLFLTAVLATGCDSDDAEPDVVSFEVDFDPAADNAILDRTVATIDYDAPEITPAVVDRGFVTAYMREQDTWTALPFTYGVESDELNAVDYTVTLGYAYDPDLLQVFYEISYDNEDLLTDLPPREIKVVVFGEGAAGGQSVNFSNYEAVREHFNLEE